mgnify:CR=1 FL=1
MSDYWEEQKKQPDLNTWLEELRGSILCDCGHGCRDWIATNGGKALRIIEALRKGADISILDGIVQKHTDEVRKDIWDENMKNMMEERKAKRDRQET